MRQGLRLLEGTDLNKFIFAEKCCSMNNVAECWVELLRLTKKEKLEKLGIVMSKARASLSGTELERLHEIWTQ
ncbi:Oidioi.mRNA.OKI2018_I69.chr2.g5565.t1.cds [Oikopleura dioica]|uniref:Oidioi.mRNA.OKI2018_I69.chr2.g5565.t1.cds n=1 Tax=Oikopleura dioica TaxID=34765 RepID=A0ABN7T4A6_OIKDI|nr:Oidioi.mRNA.OKI2018_I69.chr2.g5565.t1.cds [Oikopleura dioica]